MSINLLSLLHFEICSGQTSIKISLQLSESKKSMILKKINIVFEICVIRTLYVEVSSVSNDWWCYTRVITKFEKKTIPSFEKCFE